MSAEDMTAWRNIAIIPGIIGLVCFLGVILGREWVKRELRQKMCEPISVRWRPLAWWPVTGTAFRVPYKDQKGFIHMAQCRLPNGHRPVIWKKDEIIDVA
jgi:hypothetical protein